MSPWLLTLTLLAAFAVPAVAHVNPITHPTLPTCAAGDPRLLLPDLVPDAPTKDRTNRRNGRRIQEFTTAVGNVGDGPLLVEGKTIDTPDGEMTAAWQLIERRGTGRCARFAGTFTYHPTHLHWHFERFVSYELRADDPHIGRFVAEGSKASFCLLDLDIVDGFPGGVPPRQTNQMTCESSEGIQAISVGWKDVYDRTLDEQFIELDGNPPVPAGSYYLVNAVDPDGMLWEKDVSNNVSFVRTTILLEAPPNPIATPTRVPTPIMTPRPGGNDNIRPGRPPRPNRPSRPPRATPAINRTPATATRAAATPTRVPATATRAIPPTMAPTIFVPPTSTPRAPRPTRPSFPTMAPTQPRPTATPTTPPSGGGDPSFARCATACPYEFSQARLNWRATGLDLGFAMRARNCPAFDFQSGEKGAVYMTNWITTDGEDTGKYYSSTFTLANQSGATSDAGMVRYTYFAGGMVNFTYTSPAAPVSGLWDGYDFPVAVDICLVVGDQAMKTRLVCQPKSDGALCHEG